MIAQSGEHNHPARSTEVQRYKFKNQLNQSSKDETIPISQIKRDNVARQVGMQGEGMLGIGNVENIPPAFSSLRSSAYRARLSTLPPVSNTADEYVIENDIIEQVMILDIHNANNGQPRFIIRKALPNEWECETAEWVR